MTDDRRSRVLPSTAIVSLLALFGLVAGIFFYNARAVDQQSNAALVSNVSGRLRTEVERYVKDVSLVSQGVQADPAATLAQVNQIVGALVEGGTVPALQGGGTIEVPRPPQSSAVLAKLRQAEKLAADLALKGSHLLTLEPGSPQYDTALLGLRVVGALLSSVTNDVVGQITADNQLALAQLNRIQVLLGAVSAIAAVAMGLVFMRAGRSQEAARFRALARNASDLVTVTGSDGVVGYVSPSVQSLLGYPPDDLTGRVFLDLVHPDDQQLVVAALGETEANSGAPVRAEYRLRHALGHWCFMESSWTNLTADPAVGGLVANSRDVSDRRVLEEELRRKAFRDDLTGLPNRALFGDRVGQAVTRARRAGGVVTVLFIDLDDFKMVNDSLGHSAGDRLLIAVAARIESCVRSIDTAARLGGDEFGILLADGSTVDTAEALAARLLASVREPFEVDGRPLPVSASVGIACQGAEHLTSEELLRDADVAMYVAKTRGKGRAEVFAPRMHREVVERQRLGADLQQALRQDELEVYYQPLVDLQTGSVEGVEALLRWHHPSSGEIPPVVFIPVAEEVGAIVEIGRWVLEQACSQIGDWTRRFPKAENLSVTVNISPYQLASDVLYDDVRRALTRSGIEPSRLVLEITEGALIGDDEETIASLLQLRSLGVRLAIDDFGTGYSSLSQLRRLPIDMLKIDKSFVDDTASGGKGSALLHSIIELGRVLDLEVVAEGIEHPHQAVALRASGSQLGQGYFYAVPAPPSDLEALLARGFVENVAPDAAVGPSSTPAPAQPPA